MMDSRERHNLLTTGRGGDFRNLVRNLTNHPADFPTKSQLKAALAEVYPGDENAKAREAIFEKLLTIAQARANGADLLELRGIVDEYVIKVETEMTKDDALLPAGEDVTPTDVSGVLNHINDYDPTEKRTRAIIDSAKADELAANLARQRAGR